jgi:HK97 family phage prohead protease
VSDRTKSLFTSAELKDDSDNGSLVAKFSTFDIVDREGDIVRRSAFVDGQEVPMVWAHDWTRPIGKGTVRLDKDHARFEGEFFPTTEGQQARIAIRSMDRLQQYSWGFRVLDTQPNEKIRGYDITKAEVFEVSPVLIGANQETATLAVKSLDPDEDPVSAAILRLANEVIELPDLGPYERALALSERAQAFASEHEPTITPEKQLHAARTALAREQLALESNGLG